jgi:hypothetical protein
VSRKDARPVLGRAVAGQMRASSKAKALRTNPHPDRPSTQFALIALAAVVRISGRERDGHAGRGPAGHSDGHKKNQKILHRPQPVVPRRRNVRQKRLTRDQVKAKPWRNRRKRTVSPVTPPSLTLLRQIVIGRSINAWLIDRVPDRTRKATQ